MSALLITLGHNASAIAVGEIDGVKTVLCGYEEERLSGIKSDSHFPEKAITKCLTYVQPTDIYITHWAVDCQLSSMSRKHYDADAIANIGATVHTLSRDFTHHDSHAYAAACFAGPTFPKHNSYVLVVDGFGNFGEHISIYHYSKTGLKLKTRYYGYGTSLGLMYQYATAYMGMKMHEDEYKLLGYEVHANKELREVLLIEAEKIATRMLENMRTKLVDEFDPLVRLDALPAIQKYWIDKFDKIRTKYDLPDPHTVEGRAAFAFLVQTILECTVLMLVMPLNAENLIVSGGVFYNVRLNYWLTELMEGKVCVYPLSGDQGNALGLYFKDNPDFRFPSNLNWGHRALSDELVTHIPGLHIVSSEDEALKILSDKLDEVGYVNLVRGSMEFGPRALCNTSTLALPRLDIVEKINYANGRNTVMPMAPVMTRFTYETIFGKHDRVFKSEQYMVVSLEYLPGFNNYSGAAHQYPDGSFTGRPQVIQESDTLMSKLLVEHPVLINTSFNIHGQPIVYGIKEAIQAHQSQYALDSSFTTVIIRN